VKGPFFGLLNQLQPEVYDLKAASYQMATTGFTFPKDPDGTVTLGEKYRKNSKGEIISLTLIARQVAEDSNIFEENKIIHDFLIKSFQDVGVKLQVDEIPEDEFLKKLAEKDFDLALTGQSMGYNLDLFPYWHSSQAKAGGLNLSMLKSFALDQQMEKIRETLGEEEKNERIKKLVNIFDEESPAIFLFAPQFAFYTDGKLQGYSISNFAFPADRFSNVSDFCVDCE
jgi:ABC-type transport system substrate-binding protein